MTIKKSNDGWLVDIQPGGRGAKRIRKTLKTKSEALQFEAWAKTQVAQNDEWIKPKKDIRRLSEVIEIWQLHHGLQLRHSRTYPTLQRVCKALGDPLVRSFKADDFASYRAQRLAEGVTANTVNREHAYLRAVFNELSRLGHWDGENPLGKLRQFKVQETELSFLTNDQIKKLLNALQNRTRKDALLIAKICLATGARWSEAELLRIQQVRAGMVQYSQTKTDKNRSIPISPELETEITNFYTDNCSTDSDRIFCNSAGSFRMAIKEANINLPEGQLTHVLRHTFASHVMMNGGNILSLQRALGHSTLQMTMRYSHLAPDHLQEIKNLNPLMRLTVG
jgi:site-specific recombinase XerD